MEVWYAALCSGNSYTDSPRPKASQQCRSSAKGHALIVWKEKHKNLKLHFFEILFSEPWRIGCLTGSRVCVSLQHQKDSLSPKKRYNFRINFGRVPQGTDLDCQNYTKSTAIVWLQRGWRRSHRSYLYYVTSREWQLEEKDVSRSRNI